MMKTKKALIALLFFSLTGEDCESSQSSGSAPAAEACDHNYVSQKDFKVERCFTVRGAGSPVGTQNCETMKCSKCSRTYKNCSACTP